VLVGGCLCEKIRYSIKVPHSKQLDAAYCHCRICQRASSAPTVPWITVNSSELTITTDKKPKSYKSSSLATRHFCDECGSQLFFKYNEDHNNNDEIDVTIVSLDKPEEIKPQFHIWTSSQISWFKVDDKLISLKYDEHKNMDKHIK